MSTVVCSPAPNGVGEHPLLRRIAGGVLALLAALGVVLAAPARPAYAHAQLTGTSPVNGQRLDVAPREIVLRFSEPVNLVRDGIRVLGPSGDVGGTGPARLDPADPAAVRLPLPAALGEGVYTVSWRVVSTDSHPIHGAFVFGVGDVDVGALPDAGARTDADAALSAAFWLFRWLGYACLALLAGGVCFTILCWPAGWAQARTRRVIAIGWAGSLACAVAVLLLQGPYAAGRSLAGIGDGALLSATLGTDYGRSVAVRLGLLLAGGALLLGSGRVPRLGPRLRAAAAVVVGVALPATWVGTGHANGEASVLPAAADTVHLSAMAIWFGGLVVLMSCVLPRSVGRGTQEVAGAVTRFSRVASTSVALLVVTGVYQAWRGIGSLAALSGSAYGSLLVFKLAVVGVLLWLGWMSRSLVLRRFVLPTVNGAAAAPAAAGSTGGRAAVATMNRTGRRAERAHEQQNLQARNQLGWSVRAEAAIGVVVIAITAMLVATPPATRSDGAGAVAPAPQPFSTQLALDGGAWVEVRMDPGRMGANSLTLAIRRADASAWDVPEVRAALYLPEQDLGPLPVTLDQVGPGDYAAPEVNIPAPGTWRLEVKVRTSEIDQTTVATEIPAL